MHDTVPTVSAETGAKAVRHNPKSAVMPASGDFSFRDLLVGTTSNAQPNTTSPGSIARPTNTVEEKPRAEPTPRSDGELLEESSDTPVSRADADNSDSAENEEIRPEQPDTDEAYPFVAPHAGETPVHTASQDTLPKADPGKPVVTGQATPAVPTERPTAPGTRPVDTPSAPQPTQTSQPNPDVRPQTLPPSTADTLVNQAAVNATRTKDPVVQQTNTATTPAAATAAQAIAGEAVAGTDARSSRAARPASDKPVAFQVSEPIKAPADVSLTIRQSIASAPLTQTSTILTAANTSTATGQSTPTADSSGNTPVSGSGLVLQAPASAAPEPSSFPLANKPEFAGSAINPLSGWAASGSLPGMESAGPVPGSPWGTTAVSGSALSRPMNGPSPTAPNPATVKDQVVVQISKSAAGMPDTIDIDLKPATLGRVEVRLDLTQDGQVAARIVAENPETLDILRAESASLERALNDVGLKTGSDGLQFDLKNQNSHDEHHAPPTQTNDEADELTEETPASSPLPFDTRVEPGRIDVHA